MPAQEVGQTGYVPAYHPQVCIGRVVAVDGVHVSAGSGPILVVNELVLYAGERCSSGWSVFPRSHSLHFLMHPSGWSVSGRGEGLAEAEHEVGILKS